MPVLIQKQAPDVLLIDTDHMCHRAFHVHQELCTSTGLSSGVVYGVLAMIHTQLTKIAPKSIVLTWGAEGSGKKRKEMSTEYKSNRPRQPNFKSQFKDIQYFFSRMGWEQYYNDQGWEADDVIATLVNFYKKHYQNIIVLSGDHDFHQLVCDQVTCVVPGTKKKPDGIYTPQTVLEKYGVPPDQLPDIYAIAGEEGDGIVGVPSIGLKTAAKIVANNGSVETILGNLDKAYLPERQRMLFNEFKDQILLNKKLVDLRCSAVELCSVEIAKNMNEAQAMLDTYEIKKFKAVEFNRGVFYDK